MSARTHSVLALIGLVCTTGCAESPYELQREVEASSAPVPMFAAESMWISEEFAFSIPSWYLDCLDEAVEWSGIGLFEDHIVVKPNGAVHENGRVSLISSTMVGSSGTWVDPKVLNHFNSGDGQGNFHVNERITWTNQASGAVMDVWTRFHAVVTGSGDVKVLADTGGATCALR